MTAYVIVGGGLAGARAAEALRGPGGATPSDTVVLIGDETDLPYERPPLSKDQLRFGTNPTPGRGDSRVHGRDWYSENAVELRLGVPAAAISPLEHTVTLADESLISYDKLLLATGSSARRLPIPGADAAGVHYLRQAGEAEILRAALGSISRLAIVGAGWIGLEVAAAARVAGVEVTVVERGELPLLAALGPEPAAVFAALHAEHGVDFRYGTAVRAIPVASGRATGVVLDDGRTVPADAVLIAAGAVPNVELARSAGLNVDNGVLVDASLRTSDPDIYAAGDIAAALHPVLSTRIRVEHWAAALNQPAVAVAGMTGGSAVYGDLPYFFTDQYDLGMEFIGHLAPGAHDTVVHRGDPGAREFITFWLSDDRVIAGMTVNVGNVVDLVKELILSGHTVDPVHLADPSAPLDELLQASER